MIVIFFNTFHFLLGWFIKVFNLTYSASPMSLEKLLKDPLVLGFHRLSLKFYTSILPCFISVILGCVRMYFYFPYKIIGAIYLPFTQGNFRFGGKKSARIMQWEKYYNSSRADSRKKNLISWSKVEKSRLIAFIFK